MNAFEQAKAVLAAAAKGEPLIAPEQNRKELADALRATREACLIWMVMALEQLSVALAAAQRGDAGKEYDARVAAVWRGLELFCQDTGLTPEQILGWYRPVIPWMEGVRAAVSTTPPDESLAEAVRQTLHDWTFREWLEGG